MMGGFEGLKANNEQEKMSFYLNEAAGDMRDIMLPTLDAAKAKL